LGSKAEVFRTIFGLGDLLAGFATNKTWLYVARAIAGIGGGGINSLTMIIVSDVVSVRERGKYLTLLGIGIATGSGKSEATPRSSP
jgi:MFS family permease